MELNGNGTPIMFRHDNVLCYILKELLQYNSGLEYGLKLENERLQKTIAKLQREMKALNKALKEMQNKKKWHQTTWY